MIHPAHPPPQATSIARKFLQSGVGQRALARRGIAATDPPVVLPHPVFLPHPVYDTSVDALEGGRWREESNFVGWRFIIRSGARHVAILVTDANGRWRPSLDAGPLAQATVEAIKQHGARGVPVLLRTQPVGLMVLAFVEPGGVVHAVPLAPYPRWLERAGVSPSRTMGLSELSEKMREQSHNPRVSTVPAG